MDNGIENKPRLEQIGRAVGKAVVKLGGDLGLVEKPIEITIEQPIDESEIKIFEPSVEDQIEIDFSEMIKIYNAVDDAEVVTLEDLAEINSGFGERSPKIIINAENNRLAASTFCKNIRKRTDMLPSRDKVGPTTEMNSIDLFFLFERWGIPMVIVRLGRPEMTSGAHYTLALKQEELSDDGNMRILVYDPMSRGERWVQLPRGENESNKDVQVLRNIPADAKYDLTVPEDRSYADDAQILEAKRTRLQFDGYNCGLMCLMMAAIRMGFKEGPNNFKTYGRDLMELDTRTTNEQGDMMPGVTVYTREEIFSALWF